MIDMKVVLACDNDGFSLKETIRKKLEEDHFEIVDTGCSADFAESAKTAAAVILEDEDSLGILFDRYGQGSFIAASKINGITAAAVSDERTAYMTRAHNNARIIAIGAGITGADLAVNIVKEFLGGSYDGGRHQIRVDMLKKMGEVQK